MPGNPKKRSKRKHLSGDIRRKGHLYVLNNYSKLPTSYFKRYLKDILKDKSNFVTAKSKIFSALQEINENGHVLEEKFLRFILTEYNEAFETKDERYYYGNPWRLINEQKFSEEFFMENIDKLEIDRINTKLNKWAKPENLSDDVKLLIRLRR